MNERTGLDCPSASATASNVPQDPAGSGYPPDSAMQVSEVSDVREAMRAAFSG